MATFRAQQIDEILNYDRSMNRIVLDNEIGQATRFNDQRNPPSNRDIKFEALLGTLVDSLKAKIAEALTSIASQQYPKTDSTKVTALLGLDDGTKDASFKNMNIAAVKRARKQQKDTEDNADAVRRAELSGRDPDSEEEQQAAEDAKDAEEDDKDEDENGVNEDVNQDEQKVTADDVAPWWSLFASGMPNRRRIPMKVGRGDKGEGEEVEKEESRTGEEAEKSKKQVTNATENILYEIISQYNGIIDKILQVTQPDGRYASKRSTASSSVGYFADVLKGIKEPLTHLIFELTQVHKPELASILNMMRSMNDIIDMSPPFQKIAVESYKSGVPDFQGLTNETQYINADGYVADLKGYLKKVQEMLNQTEHQVQAVVFNMRDKEIKKSIQKQLEAKRDGYKRLVAKVEEEIEEVQERQRLGKELEVNKAVIQEAESVYEDLEKLLIDGPKENQEFIETYSNAKGHTWEQLPIKTPGEITSVYIKRLESSGRKIERRLKAIEKYRQKYQEEHDEEEFKDPELDGIESKLHQIQGEKEKAIKKALRDVALEERMREPTAPAKPLSLFEKFTDLTPFKPLKKTRGSRKIELESVVPGRKIQLAVPNALLTMKGPELVKYAAAKGVSVNNPGAKTGRRKDEDIRKELIELGYNGSGVPNKVEAGSGGLADLLASIKPQYYHHREDQVYDFDKQHNESMANERNWQAKSNPPHTTPVGSLYPFYKKDPNSMYSFPMKLKHDNAKLHPDDTQRSARGADVSLLQGPIGGPSEREKEVMPPKRPSVVTHRTAEEATQNILKGNGKKNPKALHKLLFNDESNDPYTENEGREDGMVHSESEEEEEDRFRNKKLGPVKNKKKSARK